MTSRTQARRDLAGRVRTIRRAALARLDRTVQARIVRALDRLAIDPLGASNVTKLQGRDAEYRLRVGDWRVVYTLHEDVLMVLVVRVAHRREIYR